MVKLKKKLTIVTFLLVFPIMALAIFCCCTVSFASMTSTMEKASSHQCCPKADTSEQSNETQSCDSDGCLFVHDASIKKSSNEFQLTKNVSLDLVEDSEVVISVDDSSQISAKSESQHAYTSLPFYILYSNFIV